MEKTKVGNILKEKRQALVLTLNDVSAQTKIHPSFLAALEEGNYAVFSSEVHIKGFLKTYASFLGLNTPEILAFFRREYTGERKSSVLPKIHPLSSQKIVITPALLLTTVVIISVLLFFFYLFIQFRSFAGAPLLILDEPKEAEVSSETPNVLISGKTDPDATITINGQKISLGEEGQFTTTITLAQGLNELSIISTNKLGKSTTLLRKVSVAKEELPEIPTPVITQGLLLEIAAGPKATWLEVTTDGNKVLNGLVGAGVVKTFSASTEIIITTGNAGSTKVKLNGIDQGTLGKEGEIAEKVYKATLPSSQTETTPPMKSNLMRSSEGLKPSN